MPGKAARAALALATALLALPAATGAAHADPQPMPVNLSNSDSKITEPFSLAVGTPVHVKLDDETGEGYVITYEQPTSSDDAVLTPAQEGDGAPVPDGTADFTAAAPGSAHLVAKGTCTEQDPAADPKKCPENSDWEVFVDVVATEG